MPPEGLGEIELPFPIAEETIAFDAEGSIWLFSANVGYDHAVQRFSRDGKLLLRTPPMRNGRPQPLQEVIWEKA